MSGELTFVNIFVFLKLFPLLCVLALVTIGTGVGSARSSLTAAMDGWERGREGERGEKQGEREEELGDRENLTKLSCTVEQTRGSHTHMHTIKHTRL